MIFGASFDINSNGLKPETDKELLEVSSCRPSADSLLVNTACNKSVFRSQKYVAVPLYK
jgi:hypothetical protein